MKQSEIIKKQCTTATKTNGIFVKSCDVLKAQRQTAIEFSEEVTKQVVLTLLRKLAQTAWQNAIMNELSGNDLLKKYFGKTLDQLYEEWENSPNHSENR